MFGEITAELAEVKDELLKVNKNLKEVIRLLQAREDREAGTAKKPTKGGRQ
jgi:hypothetical protein